ncbi:hypothetical protein MRB53_039413 [Persea americana]|nr:hypothetical protein MRB53_039413 [Persea americana]
MKHDLYRSTNAAPGSPNGALANSSIHVLSLSSAPTSAFLHVRRVEAQSADMQTPAGARHAGDSVKLAAEDNADNLSDLLATKLAATWSPVRAMQLNITAGQQWQTGVFTIRLGEVKGSGSTPRGFLLSLAGDGRANNPRSTTMLQDLGRLLLGKDMVFTAVLTSTDNATTSTWEEEIDLYCRALTTLGLSSTSRRP